MGRAFRSHSWAPAGPSPQGSRLPIGGNILSHRWVVPADGDSVSGTDGDPLHWRECQARAAQMQGPTHACRQARPGQSFPPIGDPEGFAASSGRAGHQPLTQNSWDGHREWTRAARTHLGEEAGLSHLGTAVAVGGSGEVGVNMWLLWGHGDRGDRQWGSGPSALPCWGTWSKGSEELGGGAAPSHGRSVKHC